MLRPRIVPCLLVHDKGLVKTVGFSNPKYVGDPINVVKIFNEKAVDELAVYDIDATVLMPQTPAVTFLDHANGWQRVHADSHAVVHMRTAN